MNSNQRWNPAFPREKRNRFSPPSCTNVEEKKGNGIYIISSRGTFSKSRNENLFVACCCAYRSRRAAEFSTATIHRRSSIHVWIRFSVTARICIVEGATRAARVHSALLTHSVSRGHALAHEDNGCTRTQRVARIDASQPRGRLVKCAVESHPTATSHVFRITLHPYKSAHFDLMLRGAR